MLELVVLEEWARLAVRWLHVTTAIAWIGSSFYFIALDLGLRRDRALASGADGEEWQVHGGGFYHIQKFLVAPASLPEHLTWFKWESYATWLSGFAMLVLVYAVLFLILHSADYALLAGASLTFSAIAVTMFATRNEDWYGMGAGLIAKPDPAPARGPIDQPAPKNP